MICFLLWKGITTYFFFLEVKQKVWKTKSNSSNKIWMKPFDPPKELMFASWLNDLSGRLRVLRQEQLRVIQVTGASGRDSQIYKWMVEAL